MPIYCKADKDKPNKNTIKINAVACALDSLKRTLLSERRSLETDSCWVQIF